MENKFICLDFCNGELMEKKETLVFGNVLRFLKEADEPIIIYGKIIYEIGD